MAIKVFLGANDTFTASNNNLQVVGASGGTEKLLIASGVTGVTTDANVERIELAGAQSAYKFLIGSSGIIISDATTGTIITTIPSLNQAATIAFADGSAVLTQTGGATATLGAVNLTSTATVTTASLNAADVSTAPGTTPVTPVDPTPTFSITSDAAASEGATATFTVALADPKAATVHTVTLTTTGVNSGADPVATAGTDFVSTLALDAASAAAGWSYVAATGVLTAAAGATGNAVLTTTVTADAASPETGEGIKVQLSAPTGGTVAVPAAVSASAGSATTAITDVPVTFTLTASAANVYEGAPIVYTLQAYNGTTKVNLDADMSFDFSVSPGNASAVDQGTTTTNLNDFSQSSFNPSTKTITKGTGSVTYTVTSATDSITELPETYTVKAVSGATTVTTATATTLLDGTSAAGGQTFTLTTGVDSLDGTVTGLKGTGGTSSNAGDDTINGTVDSVTATNSTFTALDTINGGDGNDTFNALANAALTIPAGVTVSNVETVNFRAGTTVTADTSTWTGVTAANVTQATGAVDFTAAATTVMSVSNVSGGAVTVTGGSTQTVSVGTAGGAIALSKAGGAVSLTVTKQEAQTIAVDGGTTANVNTGATTNQGTTTIGATTAPSGAVTVTNALSNAAAAATNLTGGKITVNGGTSISVTSSATQAVMTTASTNSKVVQSELDINGSTSTTTVTVNQTAAATAVNTVLAVTGVTEVQTLTFKALTAGQTQIINGLTFTAGASGTTAAETAAAFASLDSGAKQGYSAKGTYSGTFTAGWTTASVSGTSDVVFTKTATGVVAALADTGTGDDPTVVETTAGVTAVTGTGTGGIDAGKVIIDDNATTASLTTITVNGYAASSAIGATTPTTKLATLTLSNAQATADMTVADTADTLALTLGGGMGTSTDGTEAVVSFTAAPLTLNVTATGNNYVDLTAAATTAMTVGGTGLLNNADVDLAALKTLTVKDTASVTLNGGESNTLTSVDTTAATGGTVTVTIDATAATYAGGAGVDNVTLSAAAPSKSVSLGAGNDMLTLATGTTTATGTLSGGADTDTLVMVAANATTASASATFEGQFDGFEKLSLGAVATTVADSVNLANMDDISYVISAGTTAGAGTTLTLTNMTNGGTLEFTGANAGAVGAVVTMTDATGSSDSFNLKITADATTAGGTVAVANVESIAIVSDDSGTTIDAVHTLTLQATKATSFTITGDAGLTLTNTGNVALTKIDGSAMTGALTVTAAGTVAETITGGSGADVLTASAVADVLIGGAGADTLTSGSGLATLTGGSGYDTFVINTASTNVNSYATITDATKGDYIVFNSTAGTELFKSAAVTLGDTAVFQDYANAAINSLAQGEIGWFQFSGNTYVVQEGQAAGTAFLDGTDFVVKLTGLIDLSTASYDTAEFQIRIG